MIIKKLSWKSFLAKKLITYINNGMEQSDENTITIYHNVPNPSYDGTIRALNENSKYRKLRKGSVIFYHEILSFAKESTPFLSSDVLEDITRKYISLRAENAICYAKPHFDKEHIHMHICISANEYRSGKVLNMNNKEYERVRRNIEQYQLEQYPELKDSVVYLNKPEKHKQNAIDKDKNRRKENEYQLKAHTDKPTNKEIITARIMDLFRQSTNEAEFFDLILQQADIELYSYRGKTKGVIYGGKKFRFGTIGIDKEKLMELESHENKLINQRMIELQHLQNQNTKNINKTLCR
ncbi:MAG: hypothetical protein A2033_16055 [Bacteroidetes bacterium GWA2_31_9]|nr:MAG: hypothetical protein A2033_16055 [Bacteroidetes bacterium GWA2_31_9]